MSADFRFPFFFSCSLLQPVRGRSFSSGTGWAVHRAPPTVRRMTLHIALDTRASVGGTSAGEQETNSMIPFLPLLSSKACRLPEPDYFQGPALGCPYVWKRADAETMPILVEF